jgi:hypothetical protein
MMYDLTSLVRGNPGWDLCWAYDVNDLRQVVGWGYHDGLQRAFLLTPIPEPSVLALGALGVLGMLLRKTKKH